MLVFRHGFSAVAALFFAGIVPGAGQAAFPALPEAPQPAVLPGSNNSAAAGPTKQAPSSTTALQTKTAPRTPAASSLGSSSSFSRAGTGAPAAAPAPAPATSPAGNASKIVRLYRGPGRFDETLAGQLKLALEKAYGTEPALKGQPGNGPGSPAGAGTGPGKIAQNTIKVN